MTEHHLVTGFPGFIARRLVANLLAEDPDLRITALVESRMARAAHDAASSMDAERIDLVEGDIGETGLGISDADRKRLASEVTVVFHLAAIYDLAVPLTVAQRVNVEGTGHVIDFCKECENLRGLQYVSTAYVAGARNGVVYEHELSMGQAHKNHYESTKFQAEVWVRDAMEHDELPATIYRPAIVVGDSRTGETQKFDGPYFILRAIAESVRRGSPIAQFGRSSAPFNVVPVDFVVDALAAVSKDEAAAGKTLHLVDPEPLTAKELLTTLAAEYAGKKPSFSVPASLVSASLHIKPVRKMFGGAPPESITYLNHPVRFDTRVAIEALARHDLRCPRFPEYIGPVVRFFRENEDDPNLVPGHAAK